MTSRKVQSKYKVRFHLGLGENHMKWQVSSGSEVTYYKPEDVSLRMIGATLKNQKSGANKIFEGANKTVVAWVECDSVEVLPPRSFNASPIFYNPRVAPFWRDENENNIDKSRFDCVVSTGKQLFVGE